MPQAADFTAGTRRLDPSHRLAFLGLIAVVVSGSLWAFVLRDVGMETNAWLLLLMLGLFIFGEAVQVHVEVRRQTISVSLSEIPLVLGAFLVGPLATVLTRLTASLLVMAVRRVSKLKAYFNFCLFALESTIFFVVLQLLQFGVLENAETWWKVGLAVLAVNCISTALVVTAVGWTQGWLSSSQLVGLITPIVIVGLLNVAMALTILLLVTATDFAIILLVAIGLAFVVLFRSYAASLQERRTLGGVYDFAKHVEGSTVVTDGGFLAIEAVREMLNAQRAALWLLAVDEIPGRVAYADAEAGEESYDGPADAGDPLRARVLREGGGVLFQLRLAAAAERDALHARGVAEAIGVPLSSASGVIGYMEVCDRRGDRLTFSSDDVRLLESLATHVSAASQNVQLLAKLRYDASHDRLTGLPNRLQLAEVLTEVLAGREPGGSEVAVLVVDLDSIKEVNDTLGHDAGDQLLTAASTLLVEQVPEGATVGRMGGDEFAVVMPVRDLDDAEARALALGAAISGPVEVVGVTVEINATIGLSIGPSHGASAASLLQRADVALYAGHSAGQRVTSYQTAMDESSLRRLHLGTQLREAMLGGQIYAVFQPLIDVGSNNVRCVETLLRWQHPRYGAVSPVDFIPLAERIGMITPLTMHVLQLALRQCRSWLDRDIRIEVTVNLSTRTLSDPRFAESVDLMLRDMGVSPELLTFEITESSVMADPATALPVLHALHGLGVKLAIDDFGTGYSSLAYLSRLPVDEVKIDKAFIRNMGTEINDSAITKAIIDLAHGLGLTVIAEGVEDELTRDLLAQMGCDTIQGYLVSRPLPGPRLDRWLAVRTASRPAEVGGRGRQVFITSRAPVIT